jgi:hypothetical protein
LFWIGEPARSSTYIERAIEEYNPSMRSGRSGGLDPGITSMAYRGWLLWILGYPDAALTALDQAVHLARLLQRRN